MIEVNAPRKLFSNRRFLYNLLVTNNLQVTIAMMIIKPKYLCMANIVAVKMTLVNTAMSIQGKTIAVSAGTFSSLNSVF